jgi:hypothetical protein
VLHGRTIDEIFLPSSPVLVTPLFGERIHTARQGNQSLKAETRPEAKRTLFQKITVATLIEVWIMREHRAIAVLAVLFVSSALMVFLSPFIVEATIRGSSTEAPGTAPQFCGVICPSFPPAI